MLTFRRLHPGAEWIAAGQHRGARLRRLKTYETALIGKWHIRHTKPEYWPRQRGFEYFYGAMVGEIHHFKHEAHEVGDWYRNNELIEEEGYVCSRAVVSSLVAATRSFLSRSATFSL